LQSLPLLGLEHAVLPDLDANAKAIAIRSLKLQNEGWTRDESVTE